MKNSLLLISILFLFCFAPVARAAFVVKRSAVAHTATDVSIVQHTKSAIFFERLNKRFSVLHPYQFHKQSEWVGIAALACGIIGLIVPGPNFLAILFGVLGMGRGCKVQGLAIAGFVMGILELLLFLLVQTAFVSLILL